MESVQEEASREREQEASEDPLAPLESQKVDNPALHEMLPNTLDLYASLRFRYRGTAGDAVWDDAGSRTGANGRLQFHENYWALGRVEYGFNIFNGLDKVFDFENQSSDSFSDDMFLRLGYVGLEAPKGFLTYGKSWSTYYQVASFTDRFQGAGANASGTFNAGTDGGASGTGRADRVFQSRIQIDHPWEPRSSFKPFTVHIQYQDGEKIPLAESVEYDYSTGFSFILEREGNLKTGIAFNYAAINDDDLPGLRPLGIDGDDIAVLLGFQWFGVKWYAATTFSWMDNHMTTGDGIYFNGWGSEGYGHYQVADRWWLVGGWNYLEPQAGNEQAGEYVVRYGVLGLRYTFKDFNRMIYANIRFDKSRLDSQNEEESGNVYTIGIRWDLDWAAL